MATIFKNMKLLYLYHSLTDHQKILQGDAYWASEPDPLNPIRR